MDDSVPCCRDGARGEGDHVIQKVQGYMIRCCRLFVFVLLFVLACLLASFSAPVGQNVYSYETESLLIAYSTQTDKSNMKSGHSHFIKLD